jgi:hypothetical protein
VSVSVREPRLELAPLLEAVTQLVHDCCYTGPLTFEPLSVDPDAKEELARILHSIREASERLA